MYKSPIQILTEEPQFDIDGEICRCVQNVGIEVDKMELERALRYDRGQYIKGYNDAINEVLALFDDFNDGSFLWGGLRAKIQKMGEKNEHSSK